jgi:hypothetical protein
MRARLLRMFYIPGLVLGLLLAQGLAPQVALAVTRHAVEMGDPDDSNDKPSSGPGIRDNTISYSEARANMTSVVRTPRDVTKGEGMLRLLFVYWHLLAYRGIK